MKKLLALLLISQYFYSYALVPISTTTDPNGLSAAATAATNAQAYLNQVQQAKTVATQIEGLQGLQQLEEAGTGLCNLCNPIDLAQLRAYLASINGDLCTQFTNSISNLSASQQSFTNIQSIIGALGSVNPLTASLSLAQSSATTLTAVNNTMAQVQAMQAQKMQKDLAQEKYDQEEATSMSQMNLGQ